MGFFSRRIVVLAALGAGSAFAGCQGNIGGGSGLSIPQAPGYGAPPGPGGGGQTQSRERVLDGAVYLSPKLTSVPLPQLAGFSVTIALGTPGPLAEAVPSAQPHASGSTGAATRLRTAVAHALATVLASPSGSPAPSASASASATATASAGASASPAPSGSAAPAAKSTAGASPAPSGSALPRFDTKLTVYPDDAPPPPTPMPTGEVQTFVKRDPIVRGYVMIGADLPIYGLGAIHFTLPSTEMLPKRGFTVALFRSGKHRHNTLLGYDADPTVSDDTVYSSQSEPIVLKKGEGYLLMLYGDQDGAVTPAPVPSGYPPPGNNPFPTPSGAYGGQPYYTQAPYGVTPTPYNPYATPTPFNPYSTPTPFPR